MADIQKIAEEIGSLTLLEARDLVKALEEKLGIKAAAPMAVAAMPRIQQPWPEGAFFGFEKHKEKEAAAVAAAAVAKATNGGAGEFSSRVARRCAPSKTPSSPCSPDHIR